MDDDLDLDAEETTEEPSDISAPSGDLPDWARKEVEKARREAAKYRSQLRRSELAKEYGDSVVELVPASLKLEEQRELAAKLAERFRTEQPTTEAVEEPEPPTVEVPAGLAAVAGSGSPPATSGGTLSAREIADLMARDPSAGIRAAQAKYGGTNR